MIPTLPCYNALLHCAAEAAARTDAFALLEDMMNRGVIPDATSYSCLILSCAASNRTQMAFAVSMSMSMAITMTITMAISVVAVRAVPCRNAL